MARVLVTGANGFIGGAVCKELLRSGAAVRCAVRRVTPDMAEGPHDLAAVGDIGPETDWSYALDGMDMVVHLAGRAHVAHAGRGRTDGFYTVNTRGTEKLCGAAASFGIKQFIYVSTIKVHGEASGQGPFTEKDAPAPADDYAMSKWRAEQAVNQAAGESDMKTVILRPPMVYGAGMKGNLLRLMRLVEAGVPLPFLSIDNRRSLLGVSNLAGLISHLIKKPVKKSMTFLVSDGDDLSTCEIIRLVGKALGKKTRLFPCRTDLLKLAARLLKREDAAARLMDSLAVDSSLIRRELNWIPPYPVWSGLKDAADWYRACNNP